MLCSMPDFLAAAPVFRRCRFYLDLQSEHVDVELFAVIGHFYGVSNRSLIGHPGITCSNTQLSRAFVSPCLLIGSSCSYGTHIIRKQLSKLSAQLIIHFFISNLLN